MPPTLVQRLAGSVDEVTLVPRRVGASAGADAAARATAIGRYFRVWTGPDRTAHGAVPIAGRDLAVFRPFMGRWWQAALLVTVTGCGLFREPAAVPTRRVADEQGLPESALSHPRTMAWARRLCAKMASHPASELGLVPDRPILPRMEAILVEHGLPRELVAVPAVESKYHAYARGDHGELGIWQLRPATARRFGLQVNARHDDRVHLDGSTRAAARYLAFLYARYGDWPLALAAYNAGEGRIDRALARRPGATFWDLADHGALPPISREYVPKILAVVRVTSSPTSCRDAVEVQSVRARATSPDPAI